MFDDHINDRISQTCDTDLVSKHAEIDREVSIGFVKLSSFSGNRYLYLQLVLQKQVSFFRQAARDPALHFRANFP